jgi:hypothetical protein
VRSAAGAPRSSALALVAGGVVALRIASTGHAPVAVDGVLAFVACVLVAGVAPAWWPRVALPVVIAAAASVGTSREPWLSFLSLSLVIGAVAFLALGAARALRDGVVAGLVAGGVVHASVALAQRFVLWPDALARREELQLSPAVVERLTSQRPLGVSLSPDLGSALALAAAVAALAVVVDATRARNVRALAAAALVPTTGAILASRSFGTAVAVGVAVVVVVVARRAWPLLGGLAVCGALAGVAAAARGWNAVVVSANERLWNWRVGWDAFVDAPATGHGLLRFAAAYAERRGPEANITRYAHSAPVQVLAETGVVGALGLVVAAVVVGPRVARALRSPGASPAIVAGGAVALLARALIDYDLHVGQTAMILAVVTGLAASSAPGVLDDDPASTSTSWSRPTAVGLGALAAVLSALLVWRDAAGAGSMLARVDLDVALRVAVDEVDPAARRALLAPFVDTVPAAAVVAARAALEAGDVDDALALLERARARDPSLPAVHQLLVALARRGHGDVEARLAEARRWGVEVP